MGGQCAGDEVLRTFGQPGKYSHFLFTRYWAPQRCWKAWDDGCSIIYRAKEPWAAKNFVLETVRGQYDKAVDGRTHPEVLRPH